MPKPQVSASKTTATINDRTNVRSVAMTFLDVYKQAVSEGLREDHEQLRIAQLLEDIGKRIVEIDALSPLQSWLNLLAFRQGKKIDSKGLYLWGGVGRGKTFLMDLFFEWLPIEKKKRLHFHHFMLLVHRQLDALQGKSDPLQEIARQFRKETLVLCFDEFYVSDIGDAMILAGLLEALFDSELVLIATSNTAPVMLYENGLQRDLFKPAIALIETHTAVVRMAGDLDYRLEALQQSELYRVAYPTSMDTIATDRQTLLHQTAETQSEILINERKLNTVFQGEGVAAFSFKELCETPRNAADYIELARLFHTLVIYDIPTLDENSESAARRFVAFIDESYDHNVNVVFNAAAPIASLYQGHQLQQPFERTISRVIEMQSDGYLSAAHRG